MGKIKDWFDKALEPQEPVELPESLPFKERKWFHYYSNALIDDTDPNRLEIIYKVSNLYMRFNGVPPVLRPRGSGNSKFEIDFFKETDDQVHEKMTGEISRLGGDADKIVISRLYEYKKTFTVASSTVVVDYDYKDMGDEYDRLWSIEAPYLARTIARNEASQTGTPDCLLDGAL